MVLSLKLVFQNDIRRVNFDPQTFEQAKALVKELYGLQQEFTFRYLDTDGDNLTIASEREFSEILRIHEGDCLKLVVAPVESENNQKPDQLPTHNNVFREFPHHGRRHRGFPHPHQDVNSMPTGPHPPPSHGFPHPPPHHGHPHHAFPHHGMRRQCPRRSMEPRTNAEGKIAHWANCDSCAAKNTADTTIYGIRYKCTRCPDYDLCEKCYEVERAQPGSVHDREHGYDKIDRPIPIHFGRGRQGHWRNIPVHVVPGNSEENPAEKAPEQVNEVPVNSIPAKVWCGWSKHPAGPRPVKEVPVNTVPEVNEIPVNGIPEMNQRPKIWCGWPRNPMNVFPRPVMVVPEIKEVPVNAVPEPVVPEVSEPVIPEVKVPEPVEEIPVKIEEVPVQEPDNFAVKVEQLESMGFPKTDAIDALFHAKGDIIQAVQKLLMI